MLSHSNSSNKNDDNYNNNDLMSKLKENVLLCKKCRLANNRTNVVFGEGNINAKLMFIGEGPGAEEDIQGRPFVGRAGKLLDKMILAMGLAREEVYIANIVKCRPPITELHLGMKQRCANPILLNRLTL